MNIEIFYNTTRYWPLSLNLLTIVHQLTSVNPSPTFDPGGGGLAQPGHDDRCSQVDTPPSWGLPLVRSKHEVQEEEKFKENYCDGE